MRILPLLLFLSGVFPTPSTSAAPEDARRIEERKKEDLRPTEVHYPETEPRAAPVDDLDTFYFAQMAFRRITYRYDILKALVVLKGVENQYIDLDSQIAFLRAEDLLPKRFQADFDPLQPLRKGLAAFILRKALNIRGGLFLHLFGSSERLALNELVYQGVMSAGTSNDLVSGEELTNIITRAANHLATHAQ